MEWQSVIDREFPKDAGMMEVQLANGCMLLAFYANHAWRVPLMGKPKAGQEQEEIRNVVRWRAYLPASRVSKKQRAQSPRLAWRPQPAETKPPAE